MYKQVLSGNSELEKISDISFKISILFTHHIKTNYMKAIIIILILSLSGSMLLAQQDTIRQSNYKCTIGLIGSKHELSGSILRWSRFRLSSVRLRSSRPLMLRSPRLNPVRFLLAALLHLSLCNIRHSCGSQQSCIRLSYDPLNGL